MTPFWRIWAYIKAWYEIGRNRGTLSLSSFSFWLCNKKCIFNLELVKYKCLRLKWLSLKKSHAHSDSESHLNNENCYFLCVLEGSTPLNKLSIEIHANIVLRNRNSTPHVTIVWKFWWQKLLKQRLNFNLSLLWWCRSRILFEIKASEQRHRLFSLAWSPLHHIRPGPEFMRLRSTQIRIQNFYCYLNNDQAILSQFYHK